MRRAMVGRRLQSSLFLVCSASFVRPASSFAPRQCSTSLSSSPFLKFSTCSRLFSASSMDSEVSASNSMETTTTRHDSICVGGDFAGLKATFSPKDGALIPIPEYLVPEALLEWGQEPSSLEVLVSEEEEETEQSGLKERQTICVLPAIGCGVDNLETQKTQQEFSTETTSYSKPSDSTLTLDTTTTLPSGKEGRVHQTETLFSLPDSHRVRISLNLQVIPDDSSFSYQIQSPIVMYLERQTNTTSNHGTRADGGGLDGRTVSTLLGDWLRLAHNFGKNKPLQWKPDKKEDVTATTTSVIHLPENVTIASGPAEETDTFMLQLSHFSKEGSRRMIERTFQGLESAASVQYREDSGKCLPSGE